MPNKKEFEKYATKHHRIQPAYLANYINYAQNMTRAVIEERPTQFREVDVFTRLIMDRIIFLGVAIDGPIANVIIAQLLFLESIDHEKEIIVYINTPGGCIYSGLGMYDTMQYIKCPISTVAIGLAASMGAVLLAGGEPKKRSALPHSRIMIHQPMGGFQGQAKDMEINLKQIMGFKKDLYKILAKHTGKSFETIEKDADRDYWMRPDEAKDYNMIDEILETSKK